MINFWVKTNLGQEVKTGVRKFWVKKIVGLKLCCDVVSYVRFDTKLG